MNLFKKLVSIFKSTPDTPIPEEPVVEVVPINYAAVCDITFKAMRVYYASKNLNDLDISICFRHGYERYSSLELTLHHGDYCHKEIEVLYSYKSMHDHITFLVGKDVDVYDKANAHMVLSEIKDQLDFIFDKENKRYNNWLKLQKDGEAIKALNLSEYKIHFFSRLVNNTCSTAFRAGWYLYTTFKKSVVYLSFLEDKEHFDEYKDYVFREFRLLAKSEKIDAVKVNVVTADEPTAEYMAYETWLEYRAEMLEIKRKQDEFNAKLDARCGKLEQYLKEVNNER